MLKRPGGQGLIEVIAAIMVLMLGTLALTQLTITSLALGRTVRERAVAVNLAREGVEWARSIRDSNWLRNDSSIPWNTGLSSGTDYSVAIGWDQTNRKFQTNWTPTAFEDTTLLYRTAAGAYTLSVAGNTKTIFRRIVTTAPICWDMSQPTLSAKIASEQPVGEPADCSTLGISWKEVGINVAVYVRYTDTRTFTVQTAEKLYNWRPGSPEL